MVESVSSIFTGSGQTNAIDLLKADHDSVEELFATVKENEDGDNTDTFDQIRTELELHTHIEEQIFYPHLLNVGNETLQNLTREALEEHGRVKALLGDIGRLSEDLAEFNARLAVLIEDVEHHVEEEEGEMFPMVKDQFDEATLLRLGTLMEDEKVRYTRQTARTATAR